MGIDEKVIKKIQNGHNVSYKDAEQILLNLGFDLKVRSSHHSFRKSGYPEVVTLKKRPQLYPYQIKKLQEVLEYYGYEKNKKRS